MKAQLGVLVFAAFFAASSSADTYDLYGVSTLDRARAAASAASARGVSAVLQNPAGLSYSKHNTFEMDTALTLSNVELSLESENYRKPAPSAGLSLGVSLNFRGDFLERLSWGLLFYSPYGVLSRARSLDVETPFFYRYEGAVDAYALSTSMSFRWFDWFATGLGIRIGAGQRGQVSLAIDPLLRRFEEQVFDAAQFSVLSPIAGVRAGPFKLGFMTLDFGAAYRGSLSQSVSIVSDLELRGLDVNLGLPLLSVTNFSPERYSAGIALALFERVSVEVDVAYLMWSDAPTPFLDAGVTFSGEGVRDLGLEGALDAPAPGERRVGALGFVNTFNLRTRAEVSVFENGLRLIGGYAYRPTPVPNQTSASNIIDQNAHIVSVGLAQPIALPWLINEPVVLNAALQNHALVVREITKDSALSDLPNYRAEGLVSHFSLGMRFSF